MLANLPGPDISNREIMTPRGGEGSFRLFLDELENELNEKYV